MVGGGRKSRKMMGLRFDLGLNLRNLVLTHSSGNVELLEAVTSHPQVLPSRRGSECKTSTELYDWVFRGKSLFHLPYTY